MVRFLSASAIGKIVNRVGRDRFWLRLIDYLEQDFRRWEFFEKAPRLANHSRDGVIELMPTSDGEIYCFKYVNGHPKNTRRGLQTVAAFGVLADVATGYPRLLADMTLGTAFRTAAVSALAARYLARPESETMALIGLGAQSEFQACAFQAALGVNRLRIHDVDPAAAEKFLRNMADSGLSIIRCASAQERRHRSGHCHDDHRGQTKGDDSFRQHGRRRNAPKRGRGRLPGQDRTRARHSFARGDFRGIRAANALGRRDPAIER